MRPGFAQSILLVWLALGLLAGLATKPASAAEPQSACPRREAVGAAVRALLRPSAVDTAGIEGQFELQDFGDRYAVTVKGRRRDYNDEGRDCAKRAHVAAVFVALTLAPPDIPLPEQPQPTPPARAGAAGASSTPSATPPSAAPSAAPASSAAPPATNAAPAPASAPPAPATAAAATAPSAPASPAPPGSAPIWSLQVELGALVLAAPRSEASQSAIGAELRASVLRSPWGLTLGANVATPSTLELDTVPVRESRIPFDLGVRRNLSGLRLTGTLELGLAAALTRLQQEGPAGAQTETRIELGARAAARVALNAPIGPYFSVFTQVFPFPHELRVEPRGAIGHVSPVWLGGSLGITAKFP